MKTMLSQINYANEINFESQIKAIQVKIDEKDKANNSNTNKQYKKEEKLKRVKQAQSIVK